MKKHRMMAVYGERFRRKNLTPMQVLRHPELAWRQQGNPLPPERRGPVDLDDGDLSGLKASPGPR